MLVALTDLPIGYSVIVALMLTLVILKFFCSFPMYSVQLFCTCELFSMKYRSPYRILQDTIGYSPNTSSLDTLVAIVVITGEALVG